MPHVIAADALLLDMDGTIVDSNAVVEAMWADFARTHGLDVAAVLAFSHGTPSTATLARFLPEGEDYDAWLAKISRWESEHFDGVTAMRGAAALLDALGTSRWAVVTSALADAAARRIATVGLPQPPVLIGADQVTRGKPDPEGFLAAAARLGVEPRNCVVAEDSPAGIAAGLAAGAQVIVMGDTTDAVANGLPRLRDWTGVQAVTANGRIELRLP